MENHTSIMGFGYGAIDVDGLLVEPQNGHVSMASVMCFSEKIPEMAMGIEEISCGFGGPNNGFSPKRKDVNRELLGGMPTEDGAGYFPLQNDFCSMGDNYLLGVDFTESITNLDYGTTERLQTSVSVSPWKADLFRMEEPELASLPNIGKFHDISSCSFEEVLSDENDQSISTSMDKKHESAPITKKSKKRRSQGLEYGAVCTQKRSRKPTQRYAEELQYFLPIYSKKRREVSSTSVKGKCSVIRAHKKSRPESKKVGLFDEETSVRAIQVPFAPLVHKECPKNEFSPVVHNVDRGIPLAKPKDRYVPPEDQEKSINLKGRDDYLAASLKKTDTMCYVKKRSQRLNARNHKKKHNWICAAVSPVKRDLRQKKRDDCYTLAKWKKDEDFIPADNFDEVSGRRKHHILWTIAEVKKLIDGVSQHGVGRWSSIKKLFFSTSAHRTPVDLKDKWRNLLKASGILNRGNRQGKKNPAWRPLPKSILSRVCELASVHPYPRERKSKILRDDSVDDVGDGDGDGDDSPERSTDMTLSSYRRILRSINDN